MEPERPIEKLLRDAAKKRTSGRSVELHPATRRMLQAEVARQFPKPAGARQSVSLLDALAHWWPRIGWTFGVLVGLAAAALLMVPRETPPREMALAQAKSPLETNGRDRGGSPRLAGSAGPADKQQLSASQPASAPLSKPAAAPPEPSGSSAVTLADTPARKFSNEPATLKEIPAPSQPQVAVGGRVTTEALKADQTLQPSAGANSSLTPSTAAAPAAAFADSGLTTRAPVIAQNDTFYFAGHAASADSEARFGLYSQQFKRESAAYEKKQADRDTSKATLLTSFAFELNGNRVRVVDSDGSIYSGSIEPKPATEGDLLNESTSSTTKSLALPSRNGRLESPPAGAVALPQQSPIYDFHVIGTNRSLGAKVDFAGSITGLTNSVTTVTGVTNALSVAGNNEPVNAPALDGAGIGGATNVKLHLQPAQISGKAVVGDKQSLDVHATATKP